MSNQPSVNRGTIILLDSNAQEANISPKNPYFTFQYNPEKLQHIFSQNTSTEENQGLIAEFFNLTFELDSIELDSSSQNKNSDFGIHPALAMLQLMTRPQIVSGKTSLPILVFKWGVKRTVAVRVENMTIEENSFDMILNPTRATINLLLKVLDPLEVNNNPGARGVYVNHQNTLTSMADAYKIQTGQGGPSGTNSNASAMGAAVSMNAAVKIESKTRLKA